MVLPGQEIGGMEEHLEIGTYFWLYLKIEPIAHNGRLTLGKWSHLSAIESFTIGEILSHNHLSVLKIKEIPSLLCEMHMEILGQEIGYLTRVHYLLDSLFIIIARHCSRLVEVHGSIPQTFTDLEQTLYLNLSHRWTVQEMAAIVGLGTTSFCEKLKRHTGYSPGLFLINIRISKAKELIKRGQANITDIALITGFYSSQHFSTTFKRFTGNTPGEFKKKMLNLP
jgi:AraC-like DNA-binding protein